MTTEYCSKVTTVLLTVALVLILIAGVGIYGINNGYYQKVNSYIFLSAVSDNSIVYKLSNNITSLCQNNNDTCKYDALSTWVYENITYKTNFNTLSIKPEDTLKNMSGDCKNFAVLMASMLRVQDINSYFITQEKHICLMVKLEKDAEYIYKPWNCYDDEDYGMMVRIPSIFENITADNNLFK